MFGRILLFVVKVVSIYAEDPLKILQSLTHENFINETQILYFYPTSSVLDLNKFLKNYPVSEKVFYISNNFSSLPKDVDGYIFDFSSVEASPVIEHQELLKIKPHTRAIIISNGNQTSVLKTFALELSYKAIAVTILQLDCSAEGQCSENSYVTFGSGKTVLVQKMETLDSNLLFTKPLTFIYPRSIRVSLFNCVPFVVFDENNEPSSGIEYNIMKHVTKNWRVEYVTFNETGNDAFGKVRRNVKSGKADLGVCALWMVKANDEEEGAFEMTHPHENICATFLVPKPMIYKGFMYPYLPLNPNMWLAILVCSILLYLTMLLVNWVYSQMGTKTINAGVALLNIIRILSSGSVPPSANSWKITLKRLVLQWCIVCMILTAAYSAGITSTFNIPRYTKPIRTLSDVVERKLKLLGTPSFINEVCEKSENPVYYKLRKRFVDNASVSAHEPYGIFVKRIQNYYVMNTEDLNEMQKESYRILDKCVMSFYLTLFVPRNSPFKRHFHQQSLLLQEHGIVNAWKRNLIVGGRFQYMQNFFTEQQLSYNYQPLDMNKLKGVFLLLVCGHVCSICMFVGELIRKRES